MAENDAQWLAENVILPQYRALTEEMSSVKKCNVKMKLTLEKLKARDKQQKKEIEDLKDTVEKLVTVFRVHVSDKKSHYVSTYNETTTQRIQRKWKEYLAIVTATTVLMTTVLAILQTLVEAGVI